MIFKAPGSLFGSLKRVQHGVPIAASTRRLSESLVNASWSALGGLWSRKKIFLNGSWTVQEEFQDSFHQKGGPKWDPFGSSAASIYVFPAGLCFPEPCKGFPRAISGLSRSILKLFCQAKKGGTAVSGRMAFRISRPIPPGWSDGVLNELLLCFQTLILR